MSQQQQAVASETEEPSTGAGAPLCVEVVRGQVAFRGLEEEWNRLADQDSRGLPFLRHDFFRLWLEHFAPAAEVEVHTVRAGGPAGQGGRLVAVLPLVPEVGGPAAWLLGDTRASASNAHSCRFDLLAEAGPQGARAVDLLWAQLAAGESVSRWILRDVPEGGHGEALAACALAQGHQVGRWPSLQSPYVELASCQGRPEALDSRLTSKFKANLRRRWKNLAARGTLEVVRHPGLAPAELEALLDQGLGLERAGWKGREGTAILSDPRVEAFYRSLARTWAEAGVLRLYALRLGGEVVAFHLGAVLGPRYFLLKPAYSEAHADCSPGQLLMREVLIDLVKEGLEELDFLGPMMPWKRDWTPLYRAHSWIYIDRADLRGRLRHGWKFTVKPVVRDWVTAHQGQLGPFEGLAQRLIPARGEQP